MIIFVIEARILDRIGIMDKNKPPATGLRFNTSV
jgi:hypothetical protein